MYPKGTLYITPDLVISEVILANPHILLLLEHFNICVPFQEKTIGVICQENSLNPDVFLTFAHLYNYNSIIETIHFSYIELHSILQFLKNSHSYYSDEMYPEIQNNIRQMYEQNSYKEMKLVEKFFNDYFKEVKEHLKYEDEIAFPYMNSLHEHLVKKKPFDVPVFYSVDEYKDHHNDIEEKLNDLKNLLIKYLPAKNDQKLRRKLFYNLTQLEYDLSIHGKIEDMILIPMVEEMEKHLKELR